MKLKQQRLEERQLARIGLIASVLGIIFTFAGIYTSRGMEVGYSRANEEIRILLKEGYNNFNNAPQIRMQF